MTLSDSFIFHHCNPSFLSLCYAMRLLSCVFIASTVLCAGTASSSSFADAAAVQTPPEETVDATTAGQVPPGPAAATVPVEFLNACTEGDAAGVEAFLKANPDYLNGRSADGETCLHVAGMS
jgi:hypothetical protein